MSLEDFIRESIIKEYHADERLYDLYRKGPFDPNDQSFTNDKINAMSNVELIRYVDRYNTEKLWHKSVDGY